MYNRVFDLSLGPVSEKESALVYVCGREGFFAMRGRRLDFLASDVHRTQAEKGQGAEICQPVKRQQILVRSGYGGAASQQHDCYQNDFFHVNLQWEE